MCVAFGINLEVATISDELVSRAKALDAARVARDFVTADAIRDELQSLGYLVETTKEGTKLRKA
jgi:cysteinyl-tRNA synthetase